MKSREYERGLTEGLRRGYIMSESPEAWDLIQQRQEELSRMFKEPGWSIRITFKSGRVKTYKDDSRTRPKVPAEGRWWQVTEDVTINLDEVESVEIKKS